MRTRSESTKGNFDVKRLVGLTAIITSVMCVFSGSVWAQETTEQVNEQASEIPVGTRYVRETHKDWTIQFQLDIYNQFKILF